MARAEIKSQPEGSFMMETAGQGEGRTISVQNARKSAEAAKA